MRMVAAESVILDDEPFLHQHTRGWSNVCIP